jgi:protein gp37
MGVSVETAKYAFRLDHLRDVPAAVRFVSAEPLLGPLGDVNLDGIDWVIAGGESGPNARPMDIAWGRDLRDQCLEAGTKFFFKQWGGRTPKAGGRELDGRTWDDLPQRAVG